MKRHEIQLVQDIANAVNVENIDNFIIDLKGVLLAYILTKEMAPDVKFQKFTWIEDGEHKINVTMSKIK